VICQGKVKVKCKVTVHAIKTWQSGVNSSIHSFTIHSLNPMFHSFLTSTLDGGEWSPSHPLEKQPLVSIEGEARWTPLLVWMTWSKEKSLAPAGNLTIISQMSSL
jgi:hypothetical protein